MKYFLMLYRSRLKIITTILCERQARATFERNAAHSSCAISILCGVFVSAVILMITAENGLSNPRQDTTYEKTILAGGCFWGMQDLLRKQPGVIATGVGYTGGTAPDPSYDLLRTGTTGHAEAVEVIFDPQKTSFLEILRFFFQIHDPTTVNRQGNDVGTQYRSAIFAQSPEQAAIAQDYIARANASGKWPGKIVTEVVSVSIPFTLAEEYHQDYLQKNPNGYTCHAIRRDWVVE